MCVVQVEEFVLIAAQVSRRLRGWGVSRLEPCLFFVGLFLIGWVAVAIETEISERSCRRMSARFDPSVVRLWRLRVLFPPTPGCWLCVSCEVGLCCAVAAAITQFITTRFGAVVVLPQVHGQVMLLL